MAAFTLDRLPLRDHRYLRNVVWNLVNERGAAQEASRRQYEASGGVIPAAVKRGGQRPAGHAGEGDGGGLSQFEKAYLKKHGQDAFDSLNSKKEVAQDILAEEA